MSKKPVPSKKQAVSSTRSRHSKYVSEQRKKLAKKYVRETIKETGEVKLRHFVSPSGMYKGQQVVTPKTGSAPIQEIKA